MPSHFKLAIRYIDHIVRKTRVGGKPLICHHSKIFIIDKTVAGKVSRWAGSEGEYLSSKKVNKKTAHGITHHHEQHHNLLQAGHPNEYRGCLSRGKSGADSLELQFVTHGAFFVGNP